LSQGREPAGSIYGQQNHHYSPLNHQREEEEEEDEENDVFPLALDTRALTTMHFTSNNASAEDVKVSKKRVPICERFITPP